MPGADATAPGCGDMAINVLHATAETTPKMTTESKKCAHPACQCPAPEGEDYCGTSCKDAGDMTEISCNCDHPECTKP